MTIHYGWKDPLERHQIETLRMQLRRTAVELVKLIAQHYRMGMGQMPCPLCKKVLDFWIDEESRLTARCQTLNCLSVRE